MTKAISIQPEFADIIASCEQTRFGEQDRPYARKEMMIKPEFQRLASKLHAAPMFFADIFGVSPERLEKLLQRRGQYHEDESLYAVVQRTYGNRVAEELWRLVGESPFVSESKEVVNVHS